MTGILAKLNFSILFLKLFPFLSKYIRLIRRSRLRQMMRGYRKMKGAGKLGRIAAVKELLSEQSLNLPLSSLSETVMGAGVSYGELVIRQNLLITVGGSRLNQALLLAFGQKHETVAMSIPKDWRIILKKQGFKVSNFRSALLWTSHVIVNMLHGSARIVKISLLGLVSKNKANAFLKRYVYFDSLGPGNLPKMVDDYQSYDIISWYLNWSGRKPDIEMICHGVVGAHSSIVNGITVESQVQLLPNLTDWRGAVKYANWGLLAIAISLLDLLRGRWWHALMLPEAALAKKLQLLPTNSIASEYLFHNSNWIYRPLWTYEAEKKGASVLFYFYSTNCESFKEGNDYPPIGYGWSAMNWPRYLVWDEYQADFVRRAVGIKANVNVVGPIWFESSVVSVQNITQNAIAVFDVAPHRASRYCLYCLKNNFYTPEVVRPFIENVNSVAKRLGILMMWKKKRNIGSLEHPNYRRLTDQIALQRHVVLVEPDISATRIIESSLAVISMPFTSTAIIAREMGRPSIYYDPTGLLKSEDRASHGIPILSGCDELEAWLSIHIPIRNSIQ
jgi:polysaccharide biosynthesis PFTS motif protein